MKTFIKPKIKKDYSNFNGKDELVSFNIGLSLWIKVDSVMRNSISLLLLATILKLSIVMSEPQVITWSRILECLGLTTGLPVRSLSPLRSLTGIILLSVKLTQLNRY